MALVEMIEAELSECDRRLAQVMADTPAGVLVSIPGVGVTAASYYGAALGDPHRFRDASAAYRCSGLSPASYESAGKASARTFISRERVGAAALRHYRAGQGLRSHEPHFGAYYRRLTSTGKPPLVALVAVGHRAYRLAFSMM